MPLDLVILGKVGQTVKANIIKGKKNQVVVGW
jgi:hypothetical protein